MAQRWTKFSHLKWLDSLLSRAASPFSKAESLDTYATNGYYLLGGMLAVFVVLVWSLGYVSWVLHQLPGSLGDTIKHRFQVIDINGVSETILLIVLIAVFYTIFYFWKQVRLFVGEKFANAFFGMVSGAISVGEWCLENRWWSLFIVISLASIIALGGNYLFQTTIRKDKLKANFDHWLAQVDTFSDRSRVSDDESDSYRPVSAFWSEDYKEIAILPDGNMHPAFPLHNMLDTLYLNKPTTSWIDFLRSNLPKLKSHMGWYQLRGNNEMTPSERRAWALMNILMGRIYSRISKECTECEELVEAKKYFDVVSTQYRPDPDNKRYLVAAHNGLGTVYANTFSAFLRNRQNLSPHLQLVCQDAARCAGLAIHEYTQNESDPCTFEDKRKENNIIDILSRIALSYGSLRPLDKDDLSKICNSAAVRDEKLLAICIEQRLQKLMSCAASDPFNPLIFVTAAQAFGASAELKRKADPKANIDREAVAAGHFLRLAYGIHKDAPQNFKDWEFCYFRFATEDEAAGLKFKQALLSGLDYLPTPDTDDLMEHIRKAIRKAKCP